MTKFNVHSFALTLGIVWGLCALLLGLLATLFGYGMGLVAVFGTLYIGYSATVAGSIIGGVWAFVNAYIGGAIIAWLYNKLS